MKLGPHDCTPEFALKIARYPIEAFKTLVGGSPDRNIRTIRDMRTEAALAVFTPNFHDGWTPAMESACDAALAAFLKDLKPIGLKPEEFDELVKVHPDVIGIPVYQRGDDAKTVWPKYQSAQGNHDYDYKD